MQSIKIRKICKIVLSFYIICVYLRSGNLLINYPKVVQRIHIVIIALMTAFMWSCSCSLSDGEHGYNAIVSDLMGTEINMPNDAEYQIKDVPVIIDFDCADFKIVTYIDSAGCSSCRMKLSDWTDFISELNSNENLSLVFVMVLQSDNKERVIQQLKVNDFLQPIMFDVCDEFVKNNTIPKDVMCQTFLLDSDNRIVCVGNPIYNPKLRKLYKKIIAQQYPTRNTNGTRVSISSSVPLGVIANSNSILINLDLVNRDSIPLHVEDIITSCDCCTVLSDIGEMAPKQTEKLSVRIWPKEVAAGPFKQSISLFFEEYDNPEIVTFYGYIM